MGGDGYVRGFLRTRRGPQAHFLIGGDVRAPGLVFQHASRAFDEARFDASIADPVGDLFCIDLSNLVYSDAPQLSVKLEIRAAKVFFVETGSADDPHTGLGRHLSHEINVAANVRRAGIHESIHSMGLKLLQTIDA